MNCFLIVVIFCLSHFQLTKMTQLMAKYLHFSIALLYFASQVLSHGHDHVINVRFGFSSTLEWVTNSFKTTQRQRERKKNTQIIYINKYQNVVHGQNNFKNRNGMHEKTVYSRIVYTHVTSHLPCSFSHHHNCELNARTKSECRQNGIIWTRFIKITQ